MATEAHWGCGSMTIDRKPMLMEAPMKPVVEFVAAELIGRHA
jgi:hypothetical protein